MKKKPNDRLYILMRTDMASLNPGKAVAQGAHAATKFLYDYYMVPMYKEAEAIKDRIDGWMVKRGFGTKICLAVKDERVLRNVVGAAKVKGLPSGLVSDSSYPLRDGEITHLISIVTCGYIFGSPAETSVILANLELLK